MQFEWKCRCGMSAYCCVSPSMKTLAYILCLLCSRRGTGRYVWLQEETEEVMQQRRPKELLWDLQGIIVAIQFRIEKGQNMAFVFTKHTG